MAEPPQRTPARPVLQELLDTSLILAEDWEALPPEKRAALAGCAGPDDLLPLLVEYGLLTEYQATRASTGKTFGLVLGNYRVLDLLGAGGMGVVYQAEHLFMRRPVAIKVVSLPREQPSRMLQRFYAEVRSIAQLKHPNIIAAIDAGAAAESDPHAPVLHYFVMEYVPGHDLEKSVQQNGPLPPVKACDLIRQVAGALAEAHQHHLVHRDIKPSNVLVTPEGQAKLLDFGLARHFRQRVTEPGTVLGSIDYMAPEQVRDSAAVDIRADIYGLGGVLFWCLTGAMPFPPKEDIAQELASRLTQQPPSARARRPHVSPELDAVVARMMACHPDDRYPTPRAVMNALLPFLKPEVREHLVLQVSPAEGGHAPTLPAVADGGPKVHQVLIVDDEETIRTFTRYMLEGEGISCDEAVDGPQALATLESRRFDLVLLDWAMPGLNGLEVSRRLRTHPPCANLKIIVLSGHGTSEDVGQVLAAGADDYITKPFTSVQLLARLKAALRLKDAQDRTNLLTRHLLSVNHELDQALGARDSDLVHARNALVLALAKLVEYRDNETGAHLQRLQRYCRFLAEEAACLPTFAEQIDDNFIRMVECCSPLHDIGKVGLPDHILLKPGKLDPDERIIMQAHTIIGADTLRAVMKQHGSAMAFLQMAIDIAHHHHERWDGRGYPERLAGADIPLAARLVAVADVYDALRSRRVYKPALSHPTALQLMLEGTPGQFDPALLPAFQRCAHHFERAFRELEE